MYANFHCDPTDAVPGDTVIPFETVFFFFLMIALVCRIAAVPELSGNKKKQGQMPRQQ